VSGFTVVGVDAREKKDTSFPVRVADLTDLKEITDILGEQEAVLSCLPYHLNRKVSSAAHALGIHYFDLTEDVLTTRHVRQLAQCAATIRMRAQRQSG
jgi:saccharopine dehydrogenase-like NADP-dependent oxidoreductase